MYRIKFYCRDHYITTVDWARSMQAWESIIDWLFDCEKSCVLSHTVEVEHIAR